LTNYQHTIKHPITIKGLGLHTGKEVTLTLLPAPVNTGFIFIRTDLPNRPEVPADANYVTATERGTTIEFNNASVATVEHVLAACVGAGLNNLVLEMSAQEAPIMDGSSLPFITAINEVGVQQQDSLIDYLVINEIITYKDEEKNVEMIALPYNGYKLTSMIDFNSDILGQQHATLNDLSDFEKEIAPARTFCFFRELKYLASKNLIKGGDLDNAVVVVDEVVSDEELNELSAMLHKPKMKVEETGVLNNSPLRFINEPARHKLLDIIGDLALVGKPIKGHIIASRPGHKTNVALAKLIKNNNKI
jgi:UDP-3-O-[3-hydroxymyristoyl] N-acetylglucosamine deacetylase / 3-hydroxyacyl-[acyl-carrier-protein] dehydratase